MNIAPAQGWPSGATPRAAPGTRVAAFARGLDHPRWLYVLPNGDVLVAETNAPPKPDDAQGIKGWLMGLVMKRAGAGVPSANRITLLRDTDSDGLADLARCCWTGSTRRSAWRWWATTSTWPTPTRCCASPTPPATRVSRRPASWWWRCRRARQPPLDQEPHREPGRHQLYVTVGSNSNVAERGMEVEAERAAIWEVDLQSGAHRIFATGLRNPNGLAWEPITGALWTVVNERDELGSDLVPDYLTSARDGGFYGWPYSYYGPHVDEQVTPQRPDRVAQAIAPDYALGPHTAPLGLASSAGATLPATFANGMFVGQHGSWNRRPHSGYQVIFVPFENGKPSGAPIDVLTGFLSEEGTAYAGQSH